jgi:hypothetical protein
MQIKGINLNSSNKLASNLRKVEKTVFYNSFELSKPSNDYIFFQ